MHTLEKLKKKTDMHEVFHQLMENLSYIGENLFVINIGKH